MRDIRRGQDFYPQEEVLEDFNREHRRRQNNRISQDPFDDVVYGRREISLMNRQNQVEKNISEIEINYMSLRDKIPEIWRDDEIPKEDIINDGK